MKQRVPPPNTILHRPCAQRRVWRPAAALLGLAMAACAARIPAEPLPEPMDQRVAFAMVDSLSRIDALFIVDGMILSAASAVAMLDTLTILSFEVHKDACGTGGCYPVVALIRSLESEAAAQERSRATAPERGELALQVVDARSRVPLDAWLDLVLIGDEADTLSFDAYADSTDEYESVPPGAYRLLLRDLFCADEPVEIGLELPRGAITPDRVVVRRGRRTSVTVTVDFAAALAHAVEPVPEACAAANGVDQGTRG